MLSFTTFFAFGFGGIHNLSIEPVDHIDEKPLIFAKSLLTLLAQVLGNLFVHGLTSCYHGKDLGIVREIGLVHDVSHERAASVVSGILVVLLQNFGEGTIGHNGIGFQEEQVLVQPIQTLGKE